MNSFILPILPVLALLALWWFMTVVVAQRPRIYPDPGTVVAEMLTILGGETGLGETWRHVFATIWRLVAAWSISMVVGTALGIAAGRSRLVFTYFENLVWVLMATPSIVWVFIFAVAIGVSDAVPILALSALLVPQILINVAEGARSIPGEIVAMAASYRVGRVQRLRDVFVPAVLPYILGSGRVTFALATKIILVAEVIALSSGVGYVVQYWEDRSFLGPVVAWGLLLTMFGIAVDLLVFRQVERRTAHWADRRAPVVTGAAE